MTDVQGRECVFPPDELDGRLAALRRKLAEAGIDLLILTGPENIFWVTGQQTPGYYTFQALFVTPDRPPFTVLRALEEMNFRANTRIEDVSLYLDDERPAEAVRRMLSERGLSNGAIAIEKRGWFLPITFYEELAAALPRIADGSGLVEDLRAVKSPLELSFIEAAAGYVDAGMEAAYAALAPGRSENDLVAAMLSAAVSAGSEYLGMEPLVSSGPRSGVPHGTWRRRRLEKGDPVFLELAAAHNRYHAGLMRTAWLGRAPDPARDMMRVAQDGLDAGLEALRPGRTGAEVHGAIQAVIDRAGLTNAYRKRSGYSLGISFAPDWGEWQVMSLYTGVGRELEPGMVFHIPTALRDYGVYTVGVSATAVVTEGVPRVLSRVPRPLLEIGA
jgi:Xaa-Pro dipeptidase